MRLIQRGNKPAFKERRLAFADQNPRETQLKFKHTSLFYRADFIKAYAFLIKHGAFPSQLCDFALAVESAERVGADFPTGMTMMAA